MNKTQSSHSSVRTINKVDYVLDGNKYMKNIKQKRQGRVFGRGCAFTQGNQRGRHDEKMIFSKELKEMREEGM